MEVVLIELLLWAGLIFFFWALRDGLNQAETDADGQGKGAESLASSPAQMHVDRAQQVSDPIGRYRDLPIYRFAVIDGKKYEFKHILPWDSLTFLPDEEKCIAPGLVYALPGTAD